ncbi:MAG: alpha/beta hydrolase [Candidatus Bipolaricaulota bacterium]|nr:alpha/beta hydrolase [Candidatus Bipolaricaulota bacterium]
MWQKSAALSGLLLAIVSLGVVQRSPSPSAGTVWVLVHGIWPGSGRDWRYVAPALAGQTVLRPTLPGRAGLFEWAQNVVQVFEEHRARPDRSIRVVGHSFGGAVVLFLLRTAYELDRETLPELYARLDCARFAGRAGQACRQIHEGWRRLLTDPQQALRWIRAAQKIERVFLYHAALRGACGACLDLVGLGGDTTASLCLLEDLGEFLYLPIEHVTWGEAIPIVNLYGGGEWMLSLCGLRENDFALSHRQQTLAAASCAYQEIFFDTHMHFAFALRRDVGQRLARTLHEFAHFTTSCGGAR